MKIKVSYITLTAFNTDIVWLNNQRKLAAYLANEWTIIGLLQRILFFTNNRWNGEKSPSWQNYWFFTKFHYILIWIDAVVT